MGFEGSGFERLGFEGLGFVSLGSVGVRVVVSPFTLYNLNLKIFEMEFENFHV